MDKKRCTRCERLGRTPAEHPTSDFHRSAGSPDGLQHNCKGCQREMSRESRARNAQRHAGQPVTEKKAGIPFGSHVKKETVEAVQEVQEDFEITVDEPAPTPKADLTLARLKKENTELRAQVKDLERHALTGDSVREILGTVELPNVITNPEWLRGTKEPKSTRGTAVLFLSDIHFDEVVEPSQIGGCNAYNREIAVQSLRNTFRSAIILLKQFMSAPKYDGMVLPLGGDLLSGNIHEELVETNEAPIQVSMMKITEILIEGIGALADEFGKLYVPCVTGNHGRMTRKPQAKNRAFQNFEWMVYNQLALYFKNDPRIQFAIPDGPDTSFNIYGKRYLLTHGDQFRGGDGVGGIIVPIRRGLSRKQFRQNAMGDPFDVMMIGHWHQYVHMSDLIVNGSVKGYDEYASAGNFAFEEPQQALFVCHPEVGQTFRMPVQCRYQGGKVKK